MHLFRSLKIVQIKDAAPFRQHVYQDIKKRSYLIKFTESFYNISPIFFKSMANIFYASKTLFELELPHKFNNFGIYHFYNEKRQLDFLQKVLSDKRFYFINIKKISIFNFFNNLKVLPLLLSPKVIKIINRVVKKNNFVVSTRIISTLFYYIVFDNLLKKRNIEYFLVSSDSNPYAICIMALAKKYSFKSLYINHGHIPEKPPRLTFDLNILDGQRLFEVYERVSKNNNKTVFKGCEGAYRPLNLENLKKQKIVVGVFLSLITNWQDLQQILNELSCCEFIERIILRIHPNHLVRNDQFIDSIRDIEKLEISLANEIATVDLKKCDLLIAANSSVHLTSLKFGIPSIHLNKLDDVPHDFYFFIKLGLIPYYENVKDINLKRIIEFYDQDWEKTIQYFDHYYGKSEDEIVSLVRYSIQEKLSD